MSYGLVFLSVVPRLAGRAESALTLCRRGWRNVDETTPGLKLCPCRVCADRRAILHSSHASARTKAELQRENEEVQVQFDQAKAVVATGDNAAAAELFARIATEHPKTMRGQQAAIRAGDNYAHIGEIDKAIRQFDSAAASGLAPVAGEALFQKAKACERAQRTQDALAAVDCLLLAYPDSKLREPAVDMKARLKGWSSEQISEFKTRESQAAQILAQANSKLQSETERTDGLIFVGRIERDFADTSAFCPALSLKGELLHSLGRFEDAQQAYQQAIDRLVPLAPHSPLAVRAESRLRFEIIHRSLQLCEEAIATGTKDPEKVAVARARCQRILQMPEVDKMATARARAVIVEIELFDGHPEQAEALAEKYLAKYYPRPHDLQAFPEWVLVLHFSVAQAADELGKYDKAVQKYEQIKQLLATIPDKNSGKFQSLLQRIYLEHVKALIHARTDRSITLTAARDLFKRFPGSPQSEDARRRLGLTAEEMAQEP